MSGNVIDKCLVAWTQRVGHEAAYGTDLRGVRSVTFPCGKAPGSKQREGSEGDGALMCAAGS